jgi:hypothetical protein
VTLTRDKYGRIDCYEMMNNLDNLPPRLEFFTRLGECPEAGDEGDFLKQQRTLFGSVNSDIGGIRAYREMDQMMRAMWLLLCRLLDMWTRCSHPVSRSGGHCGRCLEKHGYFVSPETWHSVTELSDAEDYCRAAGVELLGSSMARDELLADCEVKFLKAVGALHVWLKLLSPPHPQRLTLGL